MAIQSDHAKTLHIVHSHRTTVAQPAQAPPLLNTGMRHAREPTHRRARLEQHNVATKTPIDDDECQAGAIGRPSHLNDVLVPCGTIDLFALDQAAVKQLRAMQCLGRVRRRGARVAPGQKAGLCVERNTTTLGNLDPFSGWRSEPYLALALDGQHGCALHPLRVHCPDRLGHRQCQSHSHFSDHGRAAEQCGDAADRVHFAT